MTPKRNIAKVDIQKVEGAQTTSRKDVLAVEEPLEIRLAGETGGKPFDQSVSITMRTPGNDYELAAGFLYGEGIIPDAGAIHEITYCMGKEKLQQQYNIVRVRLRPGVACDLTRLQRNFYVSSSCGVCGKSSLEALRMQGCPVLPSGQPRVSKALILRLPDLIRKEQAVFEKTGGLHAAALFDVQGNLRSLHEDVGRHNAVDKVVGEQVLAGKMPLSDSVLLVSGRTSFEILQKALMAGIPIVAAVGAPSSLAVEIAQEFGLTLIGFLRGESFNIYSGAERVT